MSQFEGRSNGVLLGKEKRLVDAGFKALYDATCPGEVDDALIRISVSAKRLAAAAELAQARIEALGWVPE